jgi:hypothetical protein
MAKSYISALRELLKVNQVSDNPNEQIDTSYVHYENTTNLRNLKTEKSDFGYIETENLINY